MTLVSDDRPPAYAGSRDWRKWRRGRLSLRFRVCAPQLRCSLELVEKAVLAECPLLVAISAPTATISGRRQRGLQAHRAGVIGLTMLALMRLLGAVLAGGKGAGSGSDKAMAELLSGPLLVRAAEALAAQVRR